MSTIWIGGQHEYAPSDVGRIGFLVEVSPQDGAPRLELRDSPAVKNMSREPTLRGWCGSYNNTSTSAGGVGVITKVAKNGRAQVCELDGAAETEALRALGWPSLARIDIAS